MTNRPGICRRALLCARGFLAGMVLLGIAPGLALADDGVAYGASATSYDARFGSNLGAGSAWQASTPVPAPALGASFGGGARLSCSGVDFNGFLQSFKPAELINEIRNTVLSGAQAAVSSYLLTLAYANPTIASVLDMADKRFTARFGAFAQTCNAQAARAQGESIGAKAMADAGDQCFGQALSQGDSPTQAYRRCSVLKSFGSFDIPAAAPIADFLKRYTGIQLTPQLQALLGLLPDQRITNGQFQTRAPQSTVAGMSGRLRTHVRAALDHLDAGASSVTTCTPDILSGVASLADGCLPDTASSLVTSPAFQTSRLLSAPARTLYKDALATQIALSTLYAYLLDLYQQIAAVTDIRAGSGDAEHAARRRSQLQQQVAELVREADMQRQVQETRSGVLRTQMLAIEQVERRLAAGAAAQRSPVPVRNGLNDVLPWFAAPGH